MNSCEIMDETSSNPFLISSSHLMLMAKPFVQASLPHRNPNIPENEWVRRNGHLTLSIRPGWSDNPVTGERQCMGIPFGIIPRLLLFWLTTEAKRTGKREIYFGKTLTEFMRKIGLNPDQGGPRSDMVRLKDQMMRLFHGVITVENKVSIPNKEGGSVWHNILVTSKGNLWNLKEFDSFSYSQTIPQGTVVLSEEFFKVLTTSTVPMDERVIQAIKKSPLALDLYAFLSHRGYTLMKTGSTLCISWDQLQAQCGSDYLDKKNFKKKAITIFKKIMLFLPFLEIEFLRGRLKITSIAVSQTRLIKETSPNP